MENESGEHHLAKKKLKNRMLEDIDTPLICFEQIYTTTETIRRRFLNYFDDLAHSGRLCVQFVSHIHQSVEPTVLDGIDFIKLACSTKEPLSKINVETRNTMMELYFSISTLLLSFVFGQLAGANALRFVFGILPTSFLIIGFILLGKYFYDFLNTGTLDETEGRSISLMYSLTLGILTGYSFGNSINNISSTCLFHMPILIALVIENISIGKLLPTMNTQSLLTFISSVSILFSFITVSFNDNSHAFPSLLLAIVNCFVLSIHSQVCLPNFQNVQEFRVTIRLHNSDLRNPNCTNVDFWVVGTISRQLQRKIVQ
ncbi:unnamed protein product [Auanema sp. JU1783]|nr:unnamed protein product [Auanema sp. JU1783]